MLIIILNLLGFVDTSAYNLHPPFKLTNISEINKWSVVGTAAVLKKYIRLTSGLTYTTGGVCNRIPTKFKDWSIDLEIQANDGNHGNGFSFYFTKDFCQQDQQKWNGLSVWVNTTECDEHQRSPLYIASNDGKLFDQTSVKPVGRVSVNHPTPTILNIRRSGPDVKVYVSGADTPQTFNTVFPNLPDFGYFTVTASTGLHADNNDLFSITVATDSPATEIIDEMNLDNINRKLLDKTESRRIMKKRRRYQMSKSYQYFEEMRSKLGELDENGNSSFNDAPIIVAETRMRAGMTVTTENLMDFLVEDISEPIAKALEKLSLEDERFKETEDDMREVWGGLQQSLRGLSVEAMENMSAMKDEVLSFARMLSLGGIESNESSDARLEGRMSSEGSNFGKTLNIICIIETIAYVIFFIYKYRKTDSFRKID